MSVDPVAEANDLLRERGYRDAHLHVHVAPLPGRVLLKGSRIVSPFADSPETVLLVVREAIPPADELAGRHLTPRELREWLDQGAAGSST
jgi:hypothetical protein